jgi:hypothetical protein
MPREVEYIEVPAGTPPAECMGARRGGSCTAVIFWIERASRNKKTPDRIVRIPVDCDADDQCYAPTANEAGLGISHYTTCPDAGKF